MGQDRQRRSHELAEELRTVFRALSHRLRAESAKDHQLSLSQSGVLVRLLNDGPSAVADLARADHVSPQSMGATVASLEALGLVARKSDPNDGRRWIAQLTETGKRTFLAGRAVRQAWLTKALDARLSESEQRRLGEALDLLRKVLDE